MSTYMRDRLQAIAKPLKKDADGEMAVKSTCVWTFDGSVVVDKKKGKLSSPEFADNESRWMLSLEVKKGDGLEGSVILILKRLSFGYCNDVIAIVSFLDNQNKPCLSRVNRIPADDERWKLEMKYADLRDKLSELLMYGKLRLKCELIPKKNMLDTLPDFASSFDNRKFSDVSFVVGDQRFHAHKLILAYKSEVFAAMFEHNMKENRENVVHVDDIEHNVFAEMLRFVYCGKVNDIENIAIELLVAADKYALMDLKFICSEYLYDSLTDDNVVAMLDAADRHNVATLKSKALNFIVANSTRMMKKPNFKSMTNLRNDLLFEVIQSFAERKAGISSNMNNRCDSEDDSYVASEDDSYISSIRGNSMD